MPSSGMLLKGPVKIKQRKIGGKKRDKVRAKIAKASRRRNR